MAADKDNSGSSAGESSAKSETSDTATGTSEESESAKETEQSRPVSLAEALLRAAKDEGQDIGDGKLPTVADEPEPESETETDEEPEEKEPEPVAAEDETHKKSIDDQIAEYEKKGEKPPWYLKRISEESAKRRDRTEDAATERLARAKAEEKVQQLEAQLAKTSGPVPTAKEPFADIYDEVGLKKLENQYEEILKFTKKNRDGAEGVKIGEEVKDLDAEAIADMEYKADKALRKDLPARRQYLVERSRADAAAMEVYPEFQDPNSDMTKEAIGILRARPELETILGPEVLIWIGNALTGRKALMARNGKAKPVETPAEQIQHASKTKIAPTPTRSRSMFERKGPDIKAAKKTLEERGDNESAEALIGAILERGASGAAKRVEHIGE